MADRVSIPVIRRVRMKHGATVEVLRHRLNRDRKDVDREIRRVLDCQFKPSGYGLGLGGFAFVVWDTDGNTTVALQNRCGPVTRVLIPDFVREQLAHEITLQWSRSE